MSNSTHEPMLPPFKTTVFLMAAVLPTLVSPALSAAPLPVPASLFVQPGSGRASLSAKGPTALTIKQQTPRVTLNWNSFNIASGHSVNFEQPGPDATALNLIHDARPSAILGRLSANGEIWLLNQNGIVFGRQSQTNVRGLIASSLAPNANALSNGIAPKPSLAYSGPAFEQARDGSGAPIPAGDIHVLQGANIQTNDSNGRVLMMAPEISNAGTITANDGQVALAAGTEVFIRQPGASEGGGLVIEAGGGGIVTNGVKGNATQSDPSKLLGQVIADRGTATLVGLSVNQLGRVSANSAVRANGTVRLLARNATTGFSPGAVVFTEGGNVKLGQNSVTSANPDASDTTLAVDASKPLKGAVAISGSKVVLEKNSLVQSHSGTVSINANGTGDPSELVLDALVGDPSRIVLAAGSKIDVSGLDSEVDPQRNLLTVKLQGAELKDRPVQRDSALRGKTITVDVRKTGTLADGTPWIGTPLADLRGAAAADTRRNNTERNSTGGKISLRSQGGVLQAAGSELNVSGGVLHYPEGAAATTLLFREGQLVDVSDADPNVRYDGLYGETSRIAQKWGPIERWSFLTQSGEAASTPAYNEGKDAGLISIIAPALVLAGELTGSARSGFFQRKATDLTRITDELRLSRPFDQRPQRGVLQLGQTITRDSSGKDPQFVEPDVRIIEKAGVLPTGFDALEGEFADSGVIKPEFAFVEISRRWFGEEAMGGLLVLSEAEFRIGKGTDLDLGAGGQLDVQAGQIRIEGEITAPAGGVSLLALDTSDRAGITQSSGELSLGKTSRIDVSALFTNDFPLVDLANLDSRFPILRDAGTITLRSEAKSSELGGLFTERGSVLLANGGASVSERGVVTGGKGGTISLSVGPDFINSDNIWFPTNISVEGSASAFALETGGTLSIEAPAICIGAGCGAPVSSRLDLAPSLFQNRGFARFELTASVGDLTVQRNTQLAPVQLNYLPDVNLLEQDSGALLSEVSELVRLPDFMRKPVALALTAKAGDPSALFDRGNFGSAGLLNIQEGASLVGDTGAKFSFSSDTRLYIGGEIIVPAGEISARLTNKITGTRLVEFLPAQTLWLGSKAVLSVEGTAVTQDDPLNGLTGSVLDAGTINLTAQSGYVMGERGALLDVHGTKALLDITETGGLFTSRQRREIYGGAGAINVTAAEGIYFDGTFNADGATALAPRGSLSMVLDANSRGDDSTFTPEALGLPVGPRVIRVAGGGASTPKVLPIFRDGVPDALNGVGIVNQRQLDAAGFGDLRLGALNLFRPGTALAASAISLDDGVSLSASRRLYLEGSAIQGTGRTSLSAPYVSLGNPDVSYDVFGQRVGTLTAGSGRLRVEADLIDLVGNFQLNGWRSTAFVSDGDIRLQGVQVLAIKPVPTFGDGSLTSSGDLSFTSNQLYPATLTHYLLNVVGGPDAAISFSRKGGDATDVYSVGGELTVRAPFIRQEGVLRAPMGTIALEAGRSLTLDSNSLTSTSLEGVTAPFGKVELGKDWVYQLSQQTRIPSRLVFTEQTNRAADVFPSSLVKLVGPDVSLLKGAVVDQSGGGDLLAYEFLPGLNGSTDPLAGSGVYAILPQLGSLYAPFDPQEQNGFSLKPGATVNILSDARGLSAGRYALLPAHFALLPGAYLVTPQSNYQDLVAGQTLDIPNSGTIVAGRFSSMGGVDQQSRTSGFLVQNASDLENLGAFSRSLASKFEGLVGQSRPQDAGVLQIAASNSLKLGGSVASRPVLDGVGARAEISGTNIRVVREVRGISPVNTLRLDADELTALGAPILVLGGTTQGTRDSRSLSVTADTVTVESGAKLSGTDIILAATDVVQLAAGSAVKGNVAGTGLFGELTVNGDGALLRVSAGDDIQLVRTSESGNQGRVLLDRGALLSASNSSLLDATLDAQINGQLDLSGSLSLSSSRISLGRPAQLANGVTLSFESLGALSIDTLRLSARQGLDVYGGGTARFTNLEIDAPGMVGYANVDATASLFADSSLTLANTAGAAYVSPSNGALLGTGNLRLSTAHLDFASTTNQGDFKFSGFDTNKLTATQETVASAASHLEVAGPLTLDTPILTVASGARLTLAVDSAFNLLNSAEVREPTSSDLGGAILFDAQSVVLGSTVYAPSGQVTARANGGGANDDIRVTENGKIITRGAAVKFGSATATAPGGLVALQSARGDVIIDAGGLVDASGSAKGGDAGSIELSAPDGKVTFPLSGIEASARSGYRGGAISFDVKTFATQSSLGELFTQLSASGFTDHLGARIREGNADARAAGVIKAKDIDISLDAGSLLVDQTLDATGIRGGTISLSAQNGIRLSDSGALYAKGTGGAGGRVSLSSGTASDGAGTPEGQINLAAGSRIDVAGSTGARDGEVLLRLPQASALTLADADAANDRLVLEGQIVGARSISLEGFRAYDMNLIAPGDVVATAGNALYDDAVAFMALSAAIESNLNAIGAQAQFHVRPGVEIRSVGDTPALADADLNLDAIWDFSAWRFGTEPGYLTLRAAGDLTLSDIISDGFQGTSDLAANSGGRSVRCPDPSACLGDRPVDLPILLADESWSYRLVAGADLSSANVMAVLPESELTRGASTVGNLNVIGGTPSVPNQSAGLFDPKSERPILNAVRTGTGSIEINAANNLVLSDRSAVIYTAGRDSQLGILLGDSSRRTTLQGNPYPDFGGDIKINAGKSIYGVDPNYDFGSFDPQSGPFPRQMVNSWLLRQGNVNPVDEDGGISRATGWTVAYQWFEQGVAALGGGNLAVAAGENLVDLSLSVASIGRQEGGATMDVSKVTVTGGGAMDVTVDGDVLGGVFYLGKGAARMKVGGALGASHAVAPGSASLLYPIFAIGDGAIDVVSGLDIDLAAAINPTMTPQGPAQYDFVFPTLNSHFFTYGDNSALSLTSLNGNVSLRDPNEIRQGAFENLGDSYPAEEIALRVYPATLDVAALNGAVTVDGAVTLFPSARGNIALLAQSDLSINQPLSLSDADPSALPSPTRPLSLAVDGVSVELDQLVNQLTPGLYSSLSAIPVHSGHDAETAKFFALTGDITSDDQDLLFVSRPAEFYAGNDISNLITIIENTEPDDVSLISAGRDIRFFTPRLPSDTVLGSAGALSDTGNFIEVWGPGRLLVTAGRDVDLGTAGGLLSQGNSKNLGLSGTGAAISVFSGMGREGLKLDGFITEYVTPDFAATLKSFVPEFAADGKLNAFVGFFTQLALATQELLIAEAKGGIPLTPKASRPDEKSVESLLRERSPAEQQLLADYLRLLTPATRSEFEMQVRSPAALTAYLDFLEANPSTLSVSADQGALGKRYSEQLLLLPTGQQLAPVLDIFFDELRFTGRAAAATKNPDYARGYDAVKSLLPATDYKGNVNLYFSQIFTIKGGNIDIFAPGGDINAGLATPPASFGISKEANQLGIVTEGTGDVRVYLKGDLNVNESRVFAADGGDIFAWSNFGDIDAGRGARSAISVPANGYQFDDDGKVTVSVPPPIQGSGIRALTTTVGRTFGNVDLVTPRGVVNAGEAGIESAGNITIAAVEVLGSENIKAGGDTVGVPVSSIGSIGASVGGAGNAANAASQSAADAASGGGDRGANAAPMDAPSMRVIIVEFLGFGA